MPTYRFRDNKTGEHFDKWMYMAERETYLAENPHLTQVPTGLNVVGGVGEMKNQAPDTFKDVLRRIKSNHAHSTIDV